jgi:hypothetical protein
MIESYALHPRMQDFKTWAIKNKEKFLSQINRQLQVVAD